MNAANETTKTLTEIVNKALQNCNAPWQLNTGDIDTRSPITGTSLGRIAWTGGNVDEVVTRAAEVYKTWRTTPAPIRGRVIGDLGRLLITHKDALADLVQIEVGKIRSEALGEIQEMVDICEFAVGQSRQLYGRTIASERPGHALRETWQPVGPVGIISAFNFPAAVWAWNAALAIVCGNPVIWKPSELTPLTSLVINHLAQIAALRNGAPADLFQLALGDSTVGAAMAKHPGIPVISATGSTNMGRAVGLAIAGRFGKSILELGGNNAAIVTEKANLDLAIRAITFAAAGTAGQRCTTLRRLIVQKRVYHETCERLIAAYGSLAVGDPRSANTLIGPLITLQAGRNMEAAISQSQLDGGQLLVGGERVMQEFYPDSAYMQPALIAMPEQTALVKQETFVPILYIMKYDDFEEAIAIQNDVPQGLASSIFTDNLQLAERFCGPDGSDCGIANVNIGPSGAEIGGAFGGEKETGGGRESGSDAWKAYMRRTTNTVNYSDSLPLAQGVVFG